jgi:protein-L-isoaspartate O-methyltransferase
VDPGLAARARSLVLPGSPVEIREGNGMEVTGPFDAILVNAGVTHPQSGWLDALAPGGRLTLPLTVELPLMGPGIGKGVMLLLTRLDDHDFAARTLSVVAIYSALGLRDDTVATQLAAALGRLPSTVVTRLTRRAHPSSDRCFLHTADWCLML